MHCTGTRINGQLGYGSLDVRTHIYFSNALSTPYPPSKKKLKKSVLVRQLRFNRVSIHGALLVETPAAPRNHRRPPLALTCQTTHHDVQFAAKKDWTSFRWPMRWPESPLPCCTITRILVGNESIYIQKVENVIFVGNIKHYIPCRYKSSRMLHRVDGQTVTDISEGRYKSDSTVYKSKKLLDHEVKGTTVIRNVPNHFPVNTAYNKRHRCENLQSFIQLPARRSLFSRPSIKDSDHKSTVWRRRVELEDCVLDSEGNDYMGAVSYIYSAWH